MEEPKPELVASGAFRVDARRALEKLARYQTPAPELFMLPWLRAAVAGGARDAELSIAQDGSFSMSFDGEPFDVEEAHPAALLGEEAPRGRLLALGTLAALRLAPKAVTVSSGAGPGRRCLRMTREGESVEPVESETGRSILWVIFLDRRPPPHWPERVVEECRAAPLTLRVGKTTVAPFEGDPSIGAGGAEGPLRFWLEPPPLAGPGTLQLCQWGVRACDWTPQRQLPYPSGFVNDDEFALDASQTGVVRNERFRATFSRMDSEVERLLARLAAGHASRLAEASRLLLRPDERGAWERIAEGGWAAPNDLPLFVRGEREALLTAARAHAWLRESRRVLESRTGRAPELLEALRQAPARLGE